MSKKDNNITRLYKLLHALLVDRTCMGSNKSIIISSNDYNKILTLLDIMGNFKN